MPPNQNTANQHVLYAGYDTMSMKRPSVIGLILLVLASFSIDAAAVEVPSFLRMFKRKAEAVEGKSYELSQEDGPWMILAYTFVGDGSKARADRLAYEIRRDLKLPAFIYAENFDFTGDPLDNKSGRRMAYANEYQYEAYAVLVGEYDSINNPSVKSDLERIKVAVPDVFRDADAVAAEMNLSTPATALKAMRNWIVRKKSNRKGPMKMAFATRNPLLPQDYFAATEVDSFLVSINDGLQFSLLDCPGKYSVLVRTFTGYGAIISGNQGASFKGSKRRLQKCAEDAERMVLALRKKGVEAYQYHDRDRSIVTVGSFESLGREFPGGGFEYAADIRATIQKFSALNVDPKLAQQVSDGKHFAANTAGDLPFDVQPVPIIVPKKSKRSLYTAMTGK